MTAAYDRATQDTGNIVALEHVNVCVPDQQAATAFYVMGLGFTRDPYLVTGLDNMWINIGRTQCHLPTGTAQRLRGSLGVVLPDLDALAQRLQQVASRLAGTHFGYQVRSDHIEVTCPWGNRFRCHAPSAEYGPMDLGISYVEFDVAGGAAEGIARFYREVLHGAATMETLGGKAVACVRAGSQKLLFRETDGESAPYDGHHIQIYVADFSGPYRFLSQRGLITQESSAYQYRFCEIVDPGSGKTLFTVEHEVRSLKHPLYARPLVNRNPQQSNTKYVRGHDAFRGTY